MKFDFRRQLKTMTLQELKEFRSIHVDWMLRFQGLNEKDSSRHFRYVGYIDEQIKRISNK
jgi:hypothetical protein